MGNAQTGCHPQILSEVVGGAQKYSWCSPPSTELAHTATSSHKRWRVLEPELTCTPGGGSGTPGPSARSLSSWQPSECRFLRTILNLSQLLRRVLVHRGIFWSRRGPCF